MLFLYFLLKNSCNILSSHSNRKLNHAIVITPNLHEAEALLGEEIKTVEDMKKACVELKKLGSKYVLVKGGHLDVEATDVLYDGDNFTLIGGKIIRTKNKHGTGCTLSSAIAANLAKGMSMEEAVKEAKRYITVAIEHNIELGKGCGPTNHFYELLNK